MVRFTAVLLTLLALAAPLAAQEATSAAPPRIPMAEFKKLLAENKVLVIDVRDAQSYAAGHIPGARSIPARLVARTGARRRTEGDEEGRSSSTVLEWRNTRAPVGRSC